MASQKSKAFPKGFTWGTATAAHQVEGNNWNNDWWDWEHTPGSPCVEPSGDTCDHFNRYPQDIAMLKSWGFGTYRFSVEWSRIEPEDGEFSQASIDHYKKMVQCCRDNGITPIVTLHHFTTPRWVAAMGGWGNDTTSDLFARFSDKVARGLGDEVGMWCTINEPNMVSTIGYLLGEFPPGKKDRALRLKANEVFCDAHRKSRDAVKSVSSAPLGITLAMQEYTIVGNNEDELAQAAAHRDRAWAGLEDPFLEVAKGDDFFGVQTYTREIMDKDGRTKPTPDMRLTIMGYEFRPSALEACIRRAWEQTDHVPLIVTENGVAATDDRERIEFVHDALDGVLNCIADGIDVRGYTYWTLMDNFEWTRGYAPIFGLCAVDRSTQVRTPKPSAHWLGRVAQANALIGIND
ncbi:MAG: hypothetical protein RLZZ16_23 [Actinomycetota bacterium]|jgi:beta-glucosidase